MLQYKPQVTNISKNNIVTSHFVTLELKLVNVTQANVILLLAETENNPLGF